MLILNKIKEFRDSVYSTFTARSDANMNTLDALSSYGHQCNSVVELSEAPCFERQYTSITDGIADGLVPSQFKLSTMASAIYNIEKSSTTLAVNSADCTINQGRVLLVVDCTPNPRPTARKLEDRHITYSPNPAPGNKPICVGHEYSTVAMVPNDAPSREKHWLIPLSTQRVSSEQKGHEVGMDQIKTCIETLPINNKLIVSLADSKYGSEACRKKVSQTPHWVHLFRLNSTRNIYSPAEDNQQKSDKPIKNKKRYGTKMTLNKPSTHTPPDEVITNSRINHQGQQESISISVWKNQCVRGSRQFKGYENPMTIFKITIIDDQGNARYKNPMWLAVAGQRRHELSATDVFEYYGFRYDIEHFFRFGKDKLLIDAYQTATTKHEEAWWNLASTSYLQLYFARDAVPLLPKKWERHLPIYQNTENHEKTIATPSQTQRAFSIVLDQLGTPAKPCVPRGNPIGRQLGDTQVPRKTHPVIFKAKPAIKLHKNDSVAESEKQDKNSGPEKVKKLVKSVQTQLKNMGYQVDDFHQLLLKATNA